VAAGWASRLRSEYEEKGCQQSVRREPEDEAITMEEPSALHAAKGLGGEGDEECTSSTQTSGAHCVTMPTPKDVTSREAVCETDTLQMAASAELVSELADGMEFLSLVTSDAADSGGQKEEDGVFDTANEMKGDLGFGGRQTAQAETQLEVKLEVQREVEAEAEQGYEGYDSTKLDVAVRRAMIQSPEEPESAMAALLAVSAEHLLNVDDLFALVLKSFGAGLPKQIREHSALMMKLIEASPDGTKTQRRLLSCIEALVGSGPHAGVLLVRTPKVLQALYDADVLEEDVIVNWHEKGSKKKLGTKVREAAEPFVKWLREAVEDSESEE